MNRPPEVILGRPRRWKQIALAALLIALGIGVLVRGVGPALTRIDTDFPNYFTAARIVVEGGSTERLYDEAWFRQQMHKEVPQVPPLGKFAPFPPPTALLLVPLAHLSPLAALRVTTVFSLFCLVLSIGLLARITQLSLAKSAALALLSGYAVYTSLRFGQPYIEVSTACLLGYYAWLRDRPRLAGVCFGLFVPIKYFPVFILIYFAFRRQWQLVQGGVAAAAAVVLLSVVVLGWPVHAVFLSAVLGNHLTANLNLQDPFATSFQSFDTLFRQLFVFDAAANPHPWLAAPGLAVAAVAVTKAVLTLLAVAAVIRLTQGQRIDSTAPSIGLLGILVLLIAPATATYHFVLLWLPVALLIRHFLQDHAPVYAWLTLGLYSMIGFLPYGHTARFTGQGALSIVAYPRLFLLLALFFTGVHFAWSRVPAIRPEAAGCR